jgi:hypothetical protein
VAIRTLIACAALSVCATSIARADEPPPTPPRLFHIPTGHIQPAGRGHGSAGADHRGGGLFALTYGLGGVADLDVEVTDRFVTADDDERPHASALFKLGLGERQLGFWHPAAALGFRKSFAGQSDEIAELFVATSTSLGPVNLHAGANYWGGVEQVRPFGGFEWRTGIYPRTTLLADLSWAPDLDTNDPSLRWLGAWGVRYQAFAWGSIELGVRHREDQSLRDSTVFVRVNGVTTARLFQD